MLCGSSNGPIVAYEAGYYGRACSCGTVYIDPEPPPEAVDPREDHHIEAYYVLPAHLRLKWVAQWKPAGRLLEVGCGPGHFLAAAMAHGYEVAAVEPNARCAEEVFRRLRVQVEQAFIEECSQPKASYDVVFHVDLLSHFPDPIRALKAMASLLRPGGVLCFEVGIFAGLSPRWYRWIGRLGYPQHRWFYSEAAIHQLLDRAGLKVDAMKRFGLFPATILSTVGNRFLRSPEDKPRGRDGRPAPTRGLNKIYSRLQYLLRYRIGAFVPPVGPHAVFVTASPKS